MLTVLIGGASMNYSHEDVERIAWLAVRSAVLRIGALVEGEFLEECVHTGLDQFWDEAMGEPSETVTYLINGREFQGVPGTVLTFQQLADLAGVKNADTCVFKRKRAFARAGLLGHDETVKLQGGMSITIVNTGSA